MSRCGELSLRKLIVSYNPASGDPATRQFLATHLPLFHRKYPQVQIDIRPRFWPERSITGVYRDGSEKAYCTRYLSSMGINIRCHKLVNEANDSNEPFSASHIHMQRKSVQGTWNPWLWNYESSRKRNCPPPRWDRHLTPKEWDFYIHQYSSQMKAEEESIHNRVAQRTALPDAATREVQERWKSYVTPRMQTDLEFNVAHWKRQHARGAPGPDAPRINEYSLFSLPDHTTLGQDAVDVLRRREAMHVEDWWRARKNQLKPPS